ncbi:hypothetical protein [Bradyrhizobium canariense]|uniref:Uncharacterized protein n=1 Tax=Bradyrhizobium canariense TaxID=255045 RepID=A0A1X3FVY5_9BRAD|nr:hypothetical protein [Bradyrhizobium canariense]OSI70855.1 hypothetical protein BSZ22_13130 [Bradyrhizobium canariense]OSI79696.1 hypothetical protein BSZ23_13650 [Bradyrhizobium canariense]OSI92313.1 hypothetical protein BSZ25_12635 [Bradyrhizobium canariense]OSI94035.1 hypothetical protein BSZ24_11390 [Bradyrhizobium canariense]OSJ01792.1 hypothetical protein BSZ18_38995 [Bradyrhizobium canariense]
MCNVVLLKSYHEAREERDEVYREGLFSQLMFGRVEEYGPFYQPRVSEEELAQARASTSLTPKQIARAEKIASDYADFFFRKEIERLAHGGQAVRS